MEKELWQDNVTTATASQRFTLMQRLEHWFAANIIGISGSIDGKLWVGFRCSVCGEINHANTTKL